VKDPGNDIRTAYGTALGSLTYGGNSVPVYVDEPLSIVPDYFVKVGNINITPDNQNNQVFSSIATVTLDVVTIQTGIISRDACEDISEQILTAITPNPGVCSLTSTDFQFVSAWAESLGYIQGNQGDRQVVRKILTINHKIQQL
jgi:hypothetical protein